MVELVMVNWSRIEVVAGFQKVIIVMPMIISRPIKGQVTRIGHT